MTNPRRWTRERWVAMAAALALLAGCASTSGGGKNNQKDPRYQYNMGLVYLNSQGADTAALNQAISFFQKALALDAKYYLAYNALGLAYSMKGDMSSAAGAFEKSLSLNPSFSEARNNLGSIYEAQGFLTRAEEEYKRAVMDETYASRQLPLYNLARMAFRQEKYQQALDYAERALRFDPRMAMGHSLKGMILDKLGDQEEALASFEKATRLVPDDLTFQLNLGLACLKTGRTERAREALTAVMERSEDPELRKQAAQGLDQLKRDRCP